MAQKNQILQLQQQGSDEFLCLSSGESEEIDLSYWEFINPSDADDHEIDELSLDSINDDGLFISWHSSVANSIVALEASHFDDGKSVVLDDVGVRIGGGFIEEQVSHVGDQYHDDGVDEGECRDYYEHGYDDSDGYDDDGAYDLDDELVPRAVSGKLGRQRMRKLGKRASAKVNSSKRAPFSYVKPGAVHGKHGLGMKYSC